MANISRRNSRFTLLVVALAFSVLIAGIPKIMATDEWPMFHHDLQHTGNSTSMTQPTNNTLWSYPTSGEVYCSPAVVGGVVYVGSYDNNVYALNAMTGVQIWNYTTNAGVGSSSPAVVGGVVYVGSYDNNVYALNAMTGARIWNYTTGNSVGSSPAVVGGVVYVGSYDGNVYALNTTTGVQIWNYTASGAVDSSPAVVGGVVFVGSDDGSVYALDATTGVQIWSYLTNGAVDSSPAVVDGVVYVGSYDYSVYALDATTGALIWNYATGSIVSSSPAVSSGRVYVGSWDHLVYCLNATTGAQIWNYTTGSFVFSSPAVADGKIFVGSLDGNVYCLDAFTGASVWNYTTGDVVVSSPAVAGGKVYVGSGDCKVYCFGLVDQITFDQSGIGGGYSGTVVVVDGTDSLKVSDLPRTYLFDNGSIHTFAFQSPLSAGSNKRYVWASTSGGLSSAQSDGAFTIARPGIITGNYKAQWHVTFNQTGVGLDFVGPYYLYSTVVTVDGTNYGVRDLPVTLWFDDGSRHSFAYKSPLLVVANSKQYVWTSTSGLSAAQSASIVISASGSVTGNYKTQYYLNMMVPANAGTASPGNGWHDARSSVTISVTVALGYVFKSWLGIGSGSYTGPRNQNTITMNSAIMEISSIIKTSR